jgi:hypothetical protein
MKIGSMNNSSEIHRLANSIAGLVTAITEIINAKVKEANATRAATDAVLPQQASQPIAIERWVGKKEVAEHFKISVRTVDSPGVYCCEFLDCAAAFDHRAGRPVAARLLPPVRLSPNRCLAGTSFRAAN